MFQSYTIFHIIIVVALVVHVVRTGRPYFWIFIIIFFPLIGGIAYLAAEVIPAYFGGEGFKSLKHVLHKLMQPNEEFDAAHHRFEDSPTVANRLSYARMLIARSKYDKAIEVLEPALANFFADDTALLELLATAYYHRGDNTKAMEYITKIAAVTPQPKPLIELLRASILEQQGEIDNAGDIFSRLAKTASGEEPKIAYARFLARQQKTEEAKALFKDVIERTRRSSRHYRVMQKEWIDIAVRESRKF